MPRTITISESGEVAVQYDDGLSGLNMELTPAAVAIFDYAKDILARSGYLSMHIEVSSYEEYCHVKTADGETLQLPVYGIIENDKIATLFDEEISVNSETRDDFYGVNS